MTVQAIRDAAKAAGFNVLIETPTTMVIGKPRGARHSIIIDACTEKNLAKLLKKNPLPGKASETPNPPPPEPTPPAATTPLDPVKLETVNGIGPKTATDIVAMYPTEESLIANLTTGEHDFSESITTGLKALFNL